MPLLRIYVEEAFQSALSYRYDEILEYFLANGLNISDDLFANCILDLMATARLTPDDPPINTLKLLL